MISPPPVESEDRGIGDNTKTGLILLGSSSPIPLGFEIRNVSFENVGYV